MEAVEIDEETEIEMFKAGARDSEWLKKNYGELSKKYEGKLIALKEGKIIVSDDPLELIEKIKKEGWDPRITLVVSFPPKDLLLFL